MIHRFVRRGIKIFALKDWEISSPILERNVASSQTLDRSQVESIVATFYRFFQKIKEYLFLISNKMLDVNRRTFRRCLEGSSRDFKPRLTFLRNGNWKDWNVETSDRKIPYEKNMKVALPLIRRESDRYSFVHHRESRIPILSKPWSFYFYLETLLRAFRYLSVGHLDFLHKKNDTFSISIEIYFIKR